MFRRTIIPVLVFAIIASIILPVPSYVMDFLLVANLVLALMLLMSTLYISEPLKLSSLPTILLLTTLFRLALNISSTRLILSRGHAGKAIEAFGSVVIQDNLVVGIVVFAIITLVQFIVIAKGSERVAEVSARFTLDALPGKQMSIDADVRSGLLDAESAKIKRQELQTESRFYGALDGAMKFVKGDAIAGILICLINLIGGLIIGTVSFGLPLNEAVNKFSLLSIGDGLISQIPALLNALAAGLIVTRVTNGDQSPLALEVLSQLGQIREIKALLAGLCLLVAFLPGVPIFAVLSAAAVLLIGLKKMPAAEAGDAALSEEIFRPKIPPLLELRVTKDLARLLSSQHNLSEQVDAFRQRVYDRWGLLLLRPELGPYKEAGEKFQVLIRGVEVHAESLKPAIAAADALNNILDRISEIVDLKAAEFVDDIMTRRCLDHLDRDAPELVSAVVPAVASVTQLTFVLKSLIHEGISIKNTDVILQAVAETGNKSGNERRMLEAARIGLRRLISKNYLEKNLPALKLDPVLDLAFSKAELNDDASAVQYIPNIATYLESRPDAVLVCSKSSRKLIKDLLSTRGLERDVYAYEELLPELELNFAGTVEVNQESQVHDLVERLAA